MQKVTHFTVSKNDITKFPWGDLGALPHNFFGCGGDRPHGVGAYDGSPESQEYKILT